MGLTISMDELGDEADDVRIGIVAPRSRKCDGCERSNLIAD